MKSFIFPLSVLLIITLSCGSPQPPSSDDDVIDGSDLVGTWDLKSYIDHANGGTEWTSYGDDDIYQKHLTETHFTWIHYDKANDQLIGMGGGNYSFQDGKYIENIDFFYPPASSELGQTIPFDVKFSDGKWFHTGYAKEMEIDLNTGEMVPGDSNKIEEIWVKSPNQMADNQRLAGTWDLKRYRDKLDDTYFEYPEMTGYLKLITPTHFVWIKYDKDGDQIYAAGSGSYLFDGESYVEIIDMMYPSNSQLLGSSISFDINLTDYQWEHFGYGPVKNADGSADSVLIDEIWVAHVNTLEEEVGVSF